jgi:hypothetical protein
MPQRGDCCEPESAGAKHRDHCVVAYFCRQRRVDRAGGGLDHDGFFVGEVLGNGVEL